MSADALYWWSRSHQYECAQGLSVWLHCRSHGLVHSLQGWLIPLELGLPDTQKALDFAVYVGIVNHMDSGH